MASRGALIGILGGRGVCRPVLQVLTLFQTKKCHFPHRFKTWPVRNYVTITVRRLTLKRFLKTHFEFAYIHILPLFPRKPYPNPDQIGQKFMPVFKPKRRKNQFVIYPMVEMTGIYFCPENYYQKCTPLRKTTKISISFI